MTGINLSTVNSDSPEQLAELYAQIEAGGDPAEAPAAPAAAPETKDEPAIVEKVLQEQVGEVEADGVLAKDGKNIIPFSALKGARERANQAEQMVREQTERIAALEAQLQSGNQGVNTGESARTTAADGLSDEDKAFLKEDYPTIFKAMELQAANIARLESLLNPVVAKTEAAEVEKQRTVQDSVQDAIDAVPVLAHLQNTDAEAFGLAKQFDATLRGQAAWKDKTLQERFAKVAEMVEATLGPIKLPGTSQTQQVGNLTDAAKAKAAEAAQQTRTAVPTSLSEFPAGGPPSMDEKESVENMNHFQLASKFASMTPDQQDAYLKNL